MQVWLADGSVAEHPIFSSEIDIGRAADNDLVLASSLVSAHHLRLAVGPKASLTAMDLGSLNGTLVNGHPLSARSPSMMQFGDLLQVGEFQLSVRQVTAQAPAPPALGDRVRFLSTTQPVLAVSVEGQVGTYPLSKPTLDLGRAPENDIVIPSSEVSARHARFSQSGDGWLIQDLGSTNGLFYKGRRVEQQVLREGDVVYLGESVALQIRAHRGFVPATDTDDPASSVRTVRMDKQDTITVGRAADNDIVIDHPQVNRYHMLVERLGTRRRVKDLKSHNGVFVNRRRIDGEAWLHEGDEIQVGPARLHLAAEGVQQLTEQGVRIDALRLRQQVSKSKNLLQDVSLSVYPREFVALVGLSGAGKSTLMDALNGFRPATQGRVLVNGISLYHNYELYRSDLGYVPQENIVHNDLTVYKALDYAAQLRMPADTTRKERQRRIAEVLTELDLVERKDLVIAKLSGGQRKRVSIGVELLTKPRLFFLDEPTSGLDPGTEYNMMRLLRRLADQGRTIVLVTHATKNVMMCDKVLILARGGSVAFYGPPEEALSYFDQYRSQQERRIKDIEFDDTYAILEDEKRGTPEDWHRRYRQSSAYSEHVAERFRELQQDKARPASTARPRRRRPRVSTVRQFCILTRRYLDLILRDKVLLTVLLVVMPIIAVLIILTSGPNQLVGETEAEIARQLADQLASGEKVARYTFIFQSRMMLSMMVLAAVLLGVYSAAYELVKERSIYQRERMATLRLLPYLGSKVAVLLFVVLVQVALFLFVINLKVELPQQGIVLAAPVEMYITLVLAALSAIMLGLLISAIVPNPTTVIYVVLILLFFQLILSGVTFQLPGRAAQLTNMTLTRWSNEALGSVVNIEELNELTRTVFQPDPITEDVSMKVKIPLPGGSTVDETVEKTITIELDPVEIRGGDEINMNYERTSRHLVTAWLALLAIGLASGLGTAVVLKRRDVG